MSEKIIKSVQEKGKWTLLVVASMVGFIMFLDTTMMNVAVSTIAKELNTTVVVMQVAIALYSLVMASFMVAGGKLGDIFGLQKIFVVAMVMYAIGTTVAAVSSHVGMLMLGWSIIEGLAVAILLPITTVLITVNYHGKDRAKALGIFVAIASVAGALGPIYGGAMTSYLSWRWAFASELLVVLAVFAMLRYIKFPEQEKIKKSRLDIKGTILLAFSLIIFLFSLTNASTYGFITPQKAFILFGTEIAPFGISIITYLIITGIILLIWFFKWELKLIDMKKEPLLDVNVLRNGNFRNSAIIGGILSLITMGILFVLPIFLQKVNGYSAIQVGVILLPMTVAVMIFSVFAVSLGSRFSPRSILQIGFGVVIVGVLIVERSVTSDVMSMSIFLTGLIVFGSGLGIITSQITNMAMSSVEKNYVTDASGVNNTLKQFGSAFGTAVFGTILVAGFFVGVNKNINASEKFTANQKEVFNVAAEASMQKVDPKIISELNIDGEQKKELIRIADVSVKGAMRKSLYTVIAASVLALLMSTKLSVEKFKE